MTPFESLGPLFDEDRSDTSHLVLGPRALLLRGFAAKQAPDLVAEIRAISAVSPFRHMTTPGGWEMSVALTNCGEVGWVTDRAGYRYDPIDPLTGRP
jgi:alkylated DNA repair protein (DNA oxidative demethylase)